MTNFHHGIFVIVVAILISFNKAVEDGDILKLFDVHSPDYVSVKDMKSSIQFLINNVSQRLYCFEKEMLHVEFAKCLEIDKILSMTHLDSTAKIISRENAAELSEIFLHSILDFQQSCVSPTSDIQCSFTSHHHEKTPEDINGLLSIIDTVWITPEHGQYMCFDSESILKEAHSIDNNQMNNKRLIITLLMGYLLRGHCFHVRKTKADFVDDIFHMYGDHCSSFINLEGIKKIMTDLQHSHQEHEHKHGIGHDHSNDIHHNHNHHDHYHEHDCPPQHLKIYSDHHHPHHDHNHDHDDHDHTHHTKFHSHDNIKHNLDDDHIDHIHSNKMLENLKKNLQHDKMDEINKKDSTIKSFEDTSFVSYINDDVSTEMPSIYTDLKIRNKDHLIKQPLFEDGNEKNISEEIYSENTNSSIVSKADQNNASMIIFVPSGDDYNDDTTPSESLLNAHEIHYLPATNIEDANYSEIQNSNRHISENNSMSNENNTTHTLNKRSTLNHHSLSSKSSHPEPTSHMINAHSSTIRQSLSKQNDDVQKVYLFKEKEEEIMLPFQNINLANKCWSAEELVKKFDHSGNSSLTKQDFVELCPALIQQILSGVCNKKHKLIKVPPTTWELYGYSTLSVLLITLTSLAGVLLMPLIAQRAYHYVMSGFYGLAFSTLAGDAFLHLIPQYLGVHSHGGGEHTHLHDAFLEPYMALQLVVLGSIYCLYLFEVILSLICKEKHQVAKSHGHSHVHLSNEMPSFTKTKSQAQLALSRDQSESSFDTELAEALSNKKPPNLMVSPPVILGLTSLAFVVIIGDTFHNFSDGLAIGSAFASSISGGLSTSIAVFCHELPHEFGDFIILISTGLSIPKALLINFISGCSSFIGLYIGIVIGDNELVQKYIMAFVAGIFIYVAMTEMLPELKEHHGGSRILTLLVKSLGILLGVTIMVVISIYENVTFS